MSCIEESLRAAGRSFEPEIRSRLSGFFGPILSAYLPQTWVFKTDQETASLSVDAAGKVTVAAGAAPHPDVTIEIPHDRLKAALKERKREAVPPGPIQVTPHSAKGKAAFDYLRGRLGL
jgi:hypothetical protein